MWLLKFPFLKFRRPMPNERKNKNTISFHFFFIRYSTVFVARWLTSKILPWGVSFEIYIPVRNCYVGLGLRGFVRFGLINPPLSVKCGCQNFRSLKSAECC